ncbi:ABC-three component system protein [Brevibacterium zhoupengii]|uniref:ABC-three component system protein n=1 Tax=Brevibacterium zhoupengii TaxID=2898795 RepID=UPI001F093015|nr:ABC-three component system protein [Brevibacterium zhoupengii]
MTAKDKYSASEQGLGYLYQPQFALLRLFELPESTELLIEKDDDLDFVDQNGTKSLGSLKHKYEGDRVTDLSVDFWKSVRIWLSRYNRDKKQHSLLKFLLFTTADVSNTSFISAFSAGNLPRQEIDTEVVEQAMAALKSSSAKQFEGLSTSLESLNENELTDFFARITVIESSPRIGTIRAKIIDSHMRSVSRTFRDAIFDRLQGWWHDQMIRLLTGERDIPMSGYELSDQLSAFADEYKTDNLPIHFAGTTPNSDIDVDGDSRRFVVQLREIGLKSNRIRSAILDYYRAFSQRSIWARENVLLAGEIEQYEDRLVEEWSRYRDLVFDELEDGAASTALINAGKELYNWAEFESGSNGSLRIREKVYEPYVVRGGYHILANTGPTPRVYWHPTFFERLDTILVDDE